MRPIAKSMAVVAPKSSQLLHEPSFSLPPPRRLHQLLPTDISHISQHYTILLSRIFSVAASLRLTSLSTVIGVIIGVARWLFHDSEDDRTILIVLDFKMRVGPVGIFLFTLSASSGLV